MTDAGVLDRARALLARERDRLQRAAQPRQLPPLGVTWRPTPQPFENNAKAANPANIVMIKLWDRSPVDQSSFDPTQPPLALPDPPTNTTPPSIIPLDTLEVGRQLVGQQGSWTGSPTYARQWLRAGTPIAGQTGAVYVATDDDLGLMIGLTVVASNAGGSGTANAAEVGPIEPSP